jgi:hypothetical protein
MQNFVSRTLAIATLMLVLVGASAASAQEASPAATPAGAPVIVEPSTCSVAPREDADSLVSATPTERVFPDSEADLPQGEPASQEMTDTVVAIEQELAACINDDDTVRLAALLTDEAAGQFLADLNAGQNQPAGVTTPDPVLNDVRLTLLAVRDVRVLDDGRLGAVVVWVLERSSDMATMGPELETNFHIYEEVDGQLLLAEELSGFTRETRILPAEGGGWQLDPDVLGTPYVYEPEGTPAA